MKQEVAIGQTDYTVLVKMRNDAGAPATGLAHTDIDIAYARVETDNDVTTSDVAPADLANLTAAHSDWGWEEVSATDHPGLYRLDVADAVFASGAWSAVVTVTGTGLDPADLEFVLVPTAPVSGVTAATVGSGAISEASFATTAGSFIPLGIVDQGTAQSASGTGLVIRAAADFPDGYLIGCFVSAFGSDQGRWQTRPITDNALTGDALTVDPAWTDTPSGTIIYKIWVGVPAPTIPPDVKLADAVTHGGSTAVLELALGTVDGDNIATDFNVAVAIKAALCAAWSTYEASADKESLAALIPAAFLFSLAAHAGKITTYKSDGSTEFAQYSVTGGGTSGVVAAEGAD